jgi:hypothetical protein
MGGEKVEGGVGGERKTGKKKQKKEKFSRLTASVRTLYLVSQVLY